jgi:hypothetical protein
MEGLRSHSNKGHDFQKLFLSRITQLLDIVPTQLYHHVKVVEEVGSLENAEELELRVIAWNSRHGHCKEK